MDLSRIGRGEALAAISGAALIAVMFLPWWGAAVEGVPLGEVGDRTRNAWQAASFNDVIWALTGAAAIGLGVLTATRSRPNLPVAASALVTALGILALVLIVVRLVDPPGAFGREYGAWLGLAAIVGVVCGGWLAMRDDGASFGDQVHRLERPPSGREAPPPQEPSSQPPSGGGTAA